MNYFYYYDPKMDQYIIKKIQNIESINNKYCKINNYLITCKEQVKSTIKEATEAIKTSKKILVID